jgi:hypothetical protein
MHGATIKKIQLLLVGKHVVNKFCNEFHENPTNSFISNTSSNTGKERLQAKKNQKDGRKDEIVLEILLSVFLRK